MRQTKEGRQSLPILLPLSVCNYLMKKRIKKKNLKGGKKGPDRAFPCRNCGFVGERERGFGVERACENDRERATEQEKE